MSEAATSFFPLNPQLNAPSAIFVFATVVAVVLGQLASGKKST